MLMYTGLLVWALLKITLFHSHTGFNLTYCLKSLLFASCFLFVCIFDQTQMCSLSISPLGLFQRIICNTERLKGEPWSPELLGNLNWRADLI